MQKWLDNTIDKIIKFLDDCGFRIEGIWVLGA